MMTSTAELLRRHLAKIVAIVIILALYGFARLPSISEQERSGLANEFRFTRLALPEVPGQTAKYVREVNPNLGKISAWVSSVGASVALNDLDGDGLPNDVCYVETRTDQVIVGPVPGTPPRYEAFSLTPDPLPYNSSTMAPMGCLPGDLNEDGLIDVLVYYWGRTPVAFLRPQNVPANGHVLASTDYLRHEVAPTGEEWYTNAATLSDLNGDGHLDIIIGNYFQEDSGILDGNSTITPPMQHSMSNAFNAGRNRILIWNSASVGENPKVQFTESEGILDDQTAHGWTLALGAVDLDGDLLPEIYFSNDFGPDKLLHNRTESGELRLSVLKGRKGLTDAKSKVVGNDSFKGMGVDFGDLNNDGMFDIYVSNIASEYSLEESHFAFLSTGQPERMNDGVAPYTDESESLGLSRSGWGWESRLADFNNDGVLEAVQATGFVKGDINRWPELHELAMGNDELLSSAPLWPRFQPGDDLSGRQHNPFFVRAKDGRFYDVAGELGIDQPQVTRGIASADVDGDGDLDFVVANQWEPSYVYINESPNSGAFLGLHVLLPTDNNSSGIKVRAGHPGSDTPGRPAIGAYAIVHHPDGRRLISFADGGNGHSGARSPDMHFGLGDLPQDASLQVELRWRDSEGRVREEMLNLLPGWHTVLLGEWDGR